MKRFALYLGLAIALVTSCSTKEVDFQTPIRDDVVFYAALEQPAEDGTKVYANEDLLLRWTADDRVSIFNKVTYNQEYRFTGETGDNGGSFSKVGDEFATGNAIPHVVSVYPYQNSTKISEDENLTIELPAEQLYADNTFGLGANTMVSVTSDNLLQYKNVGGYLVIKLYGEGVSVSSITLKGNNGEKLAGKASVAMPLDGTPSLVLANDASDEITLVCDLPVELGTSADESKDFWFVVPPVSFSKGFSITVFGDGGVFEKTTTKSITIERNNLSKMSPIEVTLSHPNSVIFYTSSDGEIVSPQFEDAFGANIVYNKYINGIGIISFDGEVTSIGSYAFSDCSNLSSVTLPKSVTSIGYAAFLRCGNLTSVTIPDSVTEIGASAFVLSGLTSVFIPDSVTSLEDTAFTNCENLASFSGKYASSDGRYISDNGRLISFAPAGLSSYSIPESITSIGNSAFYYCRYLSSVEIPNSVTSIGISAFAATALTSVLIPSSVTSIGVNAFGLCWAMNSITLEATIPPSANGWMFDASVSFIIFVPASSVEAYRSAEGWCEYADRIQAIPSVPEAVDLGLSVKWASFNIGATKPEESGDLYAWGDSELYYVRLDPLTWKDGKEAGYAYLSYKWCMGDFNTLTKYCTDPDFFGYNGFADGKTVLDLEDDAAHVVLGGNWRMPTDAEWTELREKCTWTWTTQNSVRGRLVTGRNGNSIFLPAAGYRNNTDLYEVGSCGSYWSSSLDTDNSEFAWAISFYSNAINRGSVDRCDGFSVRPVYAE